MRWRWPRRSRQVEVERDPYGRIPDYHTVFPPGHPRYRPSWVDLCRPGHDDTALQEALGEPTAAYRTARVPPWV